MLITPLPYPSAWKSLSFCTSPWRTVLVDRWEASRIMNCLIKPIRSSHFLIFYSLTTAIGSFPENSACWENFFLSDTGCSLCLFQTRDSSGSIRTVASLWTPSLVPTQVSLFEPSGRNSFSWDPALVHSHCIFHLYFTLIGSEILRQQLLCACVCSLLCLCREIYLKPCTSQPDQMLASVLFYCFVGEY